MPPKVLSATIEEFDDDTDFALPAPPAAAAGGGQDQMAALQQMMAQMGAGGAGAPSGSMAAGSGSGSKADEKNAEHKEWIALYPIYLDAKRPYGKGCRRVAYNKACLFPQSVHIAQALQQLGVRAVHEPRKTHPKDWENPGRVKAKLFNEDWQSTHPRIKTKKQLVEAVTEIVQPRAGGKPPPMPDLKAQAQKIREKREAKVAEQAAQRAAAAAKGKKAAGAGAGKKSGSEAAASAAAPADAAVVARRTRKMRRPAIDPIRARLAGVRFPPAEKRLPPHSPALEAGMLNMNLADSMAGAAGAMPGLAGNPMASMLGGLMGGDDDDEEEEEPKKDEKPQPGLSRRQRKKVVRIGR